jgi:hypothetical protein
MKFKDQFMTLLEDGAPYPARIRRDQFEDAYGRKPRMAGELDYFEAMDAQDRGCDVVDMTCVGDDLASYVVTRRP